MSEKKKSWPEQHPYLTTWIALSGIAAVVQVALIAKAPALVASDSPPRPAPLPRPFPVKASS